MMDSGSEDDQSDNVVELGLETRLPNFDDISIDPDMRALWALKSEIRDAMVQPQRGQDDNTRRVDLLPEDIRSIRSERHFRDRFNFVLGKRGRMAVVKFMDDYDLTSWDIRALYRIGSMTWDGRTLRLRYVLWFKLLGVSQMIGLLLLLLPTLYILFRNLDADLPARMFLVVFSSTLIFGMAWVYRSFIRPFKALKRRSA
ncbi:hypothetical protein [Ruegeria arenilitoris]|uniref:hypothetical protein n=1 Tax=Ruegeria arenilitoris TaxID=1173585 RepID=UPI00147B4FB3|nr:hypothetical protein [Ruegeria arenilitoris]